MCSRIHLLTRFWVVCLLHALETHLLLSGDLRRAHRLSCHLPQSCPALEIVPRAPALWLPGQGEGQHEDPFWECLLFLIPFTYPGSIKPHLRKHCNQRKSWEPHTSCWNVWIICSALRKVKWTDFISSVWGCPLPFHLSGYVGVDNRHGPKVTVMTGNIPRAFAMDQVCSRELSGDCLRTLGIYTQTICTSSFFFLHFLMRTYILFYFFVKNLSCLIHSSHDRSELSVTLINILIVSLL